MLKKESKLFVNILKGPLQLLPQKAFQVSVRIIGQEREYYGIIRIG